MQQLRKEMNKHLSEESRDSPAATFEERRHCKAVKRSRETKQNERTLETKRSSAKNAMSGSSGLHAEKSVQISARTCSSETPRAAVHSSGQFAASIMRSRPDEVKPDETSLRELLQQYRIVHTSPGRIRLRPVEHRPPPCVQAKNFTPLCGYFVEASVTVSNITGSVLILYHDTRMRNMAPAMPGNPEMLHAQTRTFQNQKGMANAIVKHSGTPPPEKTSVHNPIPGKMRSFFYPQLLSFGLAIFRACPYIFSAIRTLLRGRLNLDVLDGAALLVCLLRRDFRSLSSITFFFALGEYLADKTRKKSRASLAESLALNINHVWIREGETERKIPLANVQVGDIIVVRAGFIFPVDGLVVSGDGMVNQSSMTGESMPVHRSPGSSVFAGTVLEEGELLVSATKVGNETRVHAILHAIEESESTKAAIQARYERVADSIVPYNFLLSGAIYMATQDVQRASSVLLVDYSCAIRLATPLTIFTAMRDSADHGVMIKGGKFLEALAEADVVVFDKTGTLTEAKPLVRGIIPFGGRRKSSVLRLAACLEEHFAHPVGQAVVRAADAQGLKHREEHARVDFVVAHGIASQWNGQRVLIGSEHFVLEDEGIPITPDQRRLTEIEAAKGLSLLYLAVGNELAGVLLVEDSLRQDAASVVQALRNDGIKRVIMLTGDSELTAKSIARQAGITEYHAFLLPEDKAQIISSLQKEGYKVLMVGDGINDSPALSMADIGVSLADGADMAREVADVVLMQEELAGLLLARAVSRKALRRVKRNFHLSLFWNSLFLMGSLLGWIRPGVSAFLHNTTTAALSVRSAQPLLSSTKETPALLSRQGRTLSAQVHLGRDSACQNNIMISENKL